MRALTNLQMEMQDLADGLLEKYCDGDFTGEVVASIISDLLAGMSAEDILEDLVDEC